MLQTILTIPRASTLDSVREWPHIFPDLGLFGFSSERFCANNSDNIIMYVVIGIWCWRERVQVLFWLFKQANLYADDAL